MRLEIWSQTHLAAWLEYEWDENTIIIVDLYVEPKHRGKGFATELLKRLCDMASGATIEVDDMTDRYRKPRNIYQKVGFTYVNPDGPEMIWK